MHPGQQTWWIVHPEHDVEPYFLNFPTQDKKYDSELFMYRHKSAVINFPI